MKLSNARPFAALMLAALLAACGAPAPRGGYPAGSGADSAEALYRDGNFQEAAAIFEEISMRDAARRGHWLVRAADAAWQAGDPALTLDYVSRARSGQLRQQDQALAELLWAATQPVRLSAGEILGALNFSPSRLPEDYRPLYYRLRAMALLNAGQPYSSAIARLALADHLIDPAGAAENREQILRALQQLSASQARRLMERHQPSDEMYGWLDLVASIKDAAFSGQSTTRAVARWERRYPDHPANGTLTETLVSAYDQSFVAPTAIALLVPLSGPLAGAGESILDGFFAAYFAGEREATIKVYDTESSVTGAVQSYHRALAEGAGYIVGPLDKDAVTAVVLEADGTVPVLALNYSTTDAPNAPDVYEFGLLPEQEARAAAELMLAEGHARSVVLVPNTAWGDRLSEAFVDRFEYLGGEVFEGAYYPVAIGDFSAIIERILGLNAGSNRRRQLQTDLGVRLGYVPHPRHDLDAMFMAARPREGRLINPQLAFHNAGNLPVYATSAVYSGTPDHVADRDLNGVRFCDAPWLINSHQFPFSLKAARDLFESAGGPRARLFATGFDAFRVLPYLRWLSGMRGDYYPGLTGQLAVGENGEIQRKPDCAVFRGGRPQHLELEPEPIGP